MKYILSFLAAAALLFAGCAKEGLDGEATLVVKPEHHGSSIFSTAAYRDSLFIKFGVDEIPADPTRDYDVVLVGEVGENHIHVEHVKWGEYSLYCTGWDTTQNQRVVGGVIYKLKRKDRKSPEIDVVVPVSED